MSPPFTVRPPVIVEEAWERKPPANREGAVPVASMTFVCIWSTWRPVARVVVLVKRLGTERMVVDAEFAIRNDAFPAACSSQMVTWALGLVVPSVVLPVWESMERKGVAFEEEAMWRMGVFPVERPWMESKAQGEEVPMPTADAVEEEMTAPETPQGVFKVSAVPPTRNPAVPTEVMPRPAESVEVPTDAKVFLPVAYVSWFAESSEVVPKPEMVKEVPPTRAPGGALKKMPVPAVMVVVATEEMAFAAEPYKS